MEFIAFLILGAISGWIASLIMKTDGQQNLLADIIIGILGAFAGGMIMNMLGQSGATGLNFYSLFVAVLGSVVLIAIYRAVTRTSAVR